MFLLQGTVNKIAYISAYREDHNVNREISVKNKTVVQSNIKYMRNCIIPFKIHFSLLFVFVFIGLYSLIKRIKIPKIIFLGRKKVLLFQVLTPVTLNSTNSIYGLE